MRWHKLTPFLAQSDCGAYIVCSNAPDLYTPWVRHGDIWIHIDGRGCDTAKEAAEVCVRHSELSKREDAA